MLVKLLNTELIRSFGGVVINMNDAQANRYIKMGWCEPFVEKKDVKLPPKNKMIWEPPEQKIFNRIPAKDDALFPQIKDKDDK